MGDNQKARRRTVLGATVAGAGLLAGCSSVLPSDSGSSSSPTPDSSNQNSQQKNDSEKKPKVTWRENWLKGQKYALKATVKLRGASRVFISRGIGSKKLVVFDESDGQKQTKQIAGKNGPKNAVTLGTSMQAFVPDDAVPETVGSFVVGSQEKPSFPMFLNGISGSTDPNLNNKGRVKRTYTQTVNGAKTQLSIKIPKVLYKYYKSRLRTGDYGAYVSDTYDDAYIRNLVGQFEAYGERQGYSDRQVINHMMNFVQQLEYTKDKVGTGYNEYPKYPVETLYDKDGDCEDTCILLAALLEKYGYGTVLLKFLDANHMALGVKGSKNIEGTYFKVNGSRYYYVETTSDGWRVGEMPKSIKSQDKTPQVAKVTSSPVLVFNYGVRASSKGGVTVKSSMKNVGDAVAKNARFRADFRTRGGKTVAWKTSNPKQIAPLKTASTKFRMVPPDDRALRLRATVLLDGKAHDVAKSGFRKPKE